METIFLDTETTGLNKSSKIVEIAICDNNGRPVIDTLINPGCRIPPDASKIHGITNLMTASAPTIEELEPALINAVSGKHVIIYNKGNDLRYLSGMTISAMWKSSCCMERFSTHFGEWNDYHKNFKWKPLNFAAAHINYQWVGKAHRAMADCLATRAVWNWLEKNNFPIVYDMEGERIPYRA